MGQFHIDDLDKKILNTLADNARKPYLEIARECGVSGAAIHQRMQRLLEADIIAGSHLELNPLKVGYSTCAFIGIFLEKASVYDEVVKEIELIPEVTECHYTTGNYAMFIKIVAKDNNHLKDLLMDKIQSIGGVSSTETIISLEEQFKRQLKI